MNILILHMKTGRHREVNLFLKSIHFKSGRAGIEIQAGSRVWALNCLIMLIKWIIISLYSLLSFLFCDGFSPLIHVTAWVKWWAPVGVQRLSSLGWKAALFWSRGPHPCQHIRFLQGTGKKYCPASHQSFCPYSIRPRDRGRPCMGSFRKHPGWFCT